MQASARRTGPSPRSLACGWTETSTSSGRASVVPVRNVLRDSGLSDLEAELEEFSMDAGSASRAGSQGSFGESALVSLCRSAGALPYSGTSIANSCEIQLDATEPASRAE